MLPMKTVRLQLGELLAADATTLAPAANANEIALIAAPFTPGENLTIADLTFATFTGSAPKAGATGSQQAGIDPATQDQVITILAPAGGYRFECTATPSSPESIFGYALTTHLGAVLLGVVLFPAPLSIAEAGDFIDLGAVNMTLVSSPIS